MEAKLTKVVEKLLEEKREYLSLIDATKEINFRLYQKMISAGEERTNDIESTKTSEHRQNKFLQASDNNINRTRQIHETKIKRSPQPLRRNK